MKTRTYVTQHHFVCTSLLVFLTLLLAACGGASTSGGAVTPTPGKMPALQTTCPPTGTARAAVMTPLALGKQATFVYLKGSQASGQQKPSPDRLMRYSASTRTTTEIVPLTSSSIAWTTISADGQWMIYVGNVGDAGQRGIQLVRMDGQGMQTLYCGSDFGWMQWSPDNKYVAFVDPGTPPWQDPSKQTFKLLNTTTGTGLTKLTSAAAIIKDPANEEINFVGHFGWNIDLPWSNVSRDGAYYSIQVHSRADNGLDRLLIGSMNGGTPVAIASGPVNGESPIGWTTM